MILNISIDFLLRATYILKTELSPACYDKERNRCQAVRHTASSKNSNDDSHPHYASYALLQLPAKVSRQVPQECADAALLEVNSCTQRKSVRAQSLYTPPSTGTGTSLGNSESVYGLSESHCIPHW